MSEINGSVTHTYVDEESLNKLNHDLRKLHVIQSIDTDDAEILNKDNEITDKNHQSFVDKIIHGEDSNDFHSKSSDHEQYDSKPGTSISVNEYDESEDNLPQNNNNSMGKSKERANHKVHIDLNLSQWSKRNRGSFYFEDGRRRVDFILVFNTNSNKAEDAFASEARKVFETNLIDEGLHLECSNDISGHDERTFVKIHAPWEVLSRYAEIMKLKMPMKTIQTNWKMLFDEDDIQSLKFTAAYSRDKEYLFEIPSQRELFFSSAQRAQVIEFILKRKSFSPNLNDASAFGIHKLLSDKIYIAAFPLHEGTVNSEMESPRKQLLDSWASLSRVFTKQPLDEIRRYFGVKIALYFAWLGFYTSMLIPASIVGLLCFLFGVATMDSDVPAKAVCNKEMDHVIMCPSCAHDCNFTFISESCSYMRYTYLFDNPATVFFAIFMSLWATVYLEMWKRYSARITHRWDLSNFDAAEEYPRPEYLVRLSNAEKKKLNVITRMYEPYIPFWKKQLPYTIFSASVVFLLVLIAIGSVMSVIVYRATLRAAITANARNTLGRGKTDFLHRYSSIITASTAAGLNLLCIILLNQVYSRLAYKLTELEMPRTQTEFDNSLTLKMFLLQFVNYYSSIFYIAFFKGRFIGTPGDFDDQSYTQEECATGGCLLELAIQLSIIMVGKQALNALMEMGMPWVKWIFRKYRLRKKDTVETINIPQWEDDFVLAPWGPTSLFYEYLEMVLQFGFVTIFVAAFPLAPLFAIINNMFEIRLDAKKMITAFRRPVAQRVKNIGIWYKILDTIGKFSVITNAVIIAFTTDFVPRIFFYFENGDLKNYLNSTLSFYDSQRLNEKLNLGFNVSQYKHCIYPDHREPPWGRPQEEFYRPTAYYWRLMVARLSFVVVFENVITTITAIMRWLIPDVPQQLRQQIRQHTYLTNELIMQQEFKRAKEESGNEVHVRKAKNTSNSINI